MAEKKLRNEKMVMGSLGGGAVGYPSSSTSGRTLPSANSGMGSSTADSSVAWSCLCRGIGGGIASSSLAPDSSSEFPAVPGGQSECIRQK